MIIWGELDAEKNVTDGYADKYFNLLYSEVRV